MPKPVRSLAALSSAALGASLLYGAAAPAAFSADDAAADSTAWSDAVARAVDGVIAGIETAGPIVTVSAGDGERWPTMPKGVAVMPRGTVLNGDYPLVYIPALKTVDDIGVRVRELSSPRPDRAVVFEGSARDGWFTAGTSLKSGAEYAVDVRKGNGEWGLVGTFNVSSTGDAGPSASVGSLSVSEVSGRVSWAWQSPTLPGPVGGADLGLTWTSGASATTGLPEGWQLSARTGSPWMALEESPVDVAAVDTPAEPAVSGARSRITVDFAYPSDEARLVDRFVIEGQTSKGTWRVLARPGRSFAAADVDAVVQGKKLRNVRKVRVGAIVEGTTIWGAPSKVLKQAPPVTSAPDEQHLAGAESGSLATPGDLPSVVRLVSWSGQRLTFVRNPLGVYEQTGGETPGFANGLSWIRDGEWEFAALDGVVTRFVDGRVVSVATKGAPSASMTWSRDGRLTSLANEVGRTLDLHYAGDAACPTWSGFVAAPERMLCAITYPGDRTTQIGYVAAGQSAQISLIKDPGNVGETLGWDDRGRVVSVRSTLVNRVATVEPGVSGAVASVEYDADGRAATLTEAPANVGDAVMTKAIDFPRATEADLRAWVTSGAQKDAAPVTVRSSGSGYDVSREKRLDPITWQPIRITAPYGLDTSVDRAANSGQLESAVDPLGRVTQYTYDELGQVTSVEGPVMGGGAGSVTSTDYDTERVRGRDQALAGMRAQVYDRDGYAGSVSAEFWEADYTRSGLAYSWTGRGSKFSAQATAVWTPSDADDAEGAREGWDFEVQASGGSDVSLVVGGVVCPATGTICRVDALPEGPKAVTVQVSDAPSDGWFEVSAAPAGSRPAPVNYREVRPGFGLTTVSTSNDDLPGGTDVTRTEYSFTDPAQGQIGSVKSPGGLVTELAYEKSAEGRGAWGRLLTRTTPGGARQTTTYWPDRATVSLPAECGGESVEVSGQVRTLTRQDGTTVTSYYDINGRERAVVSSGGANSEIVCASYRPDGSLQTSSTYVNGELAESSAFEQAVDGDPRVARTTIAHGSASTTSGAVRSSTSTIDLLGRVVREVGLAGEITETTYDAMGNVRSEVVTPPEGARTSAQRIAFTYDPQSTLLLTVTVNGVRAAELTRDRASALITSIDYAGAATSAWRYSPSGQVDSVVVTTDNPAYSRVVDSLSMTAAGRITGRTTDVTGTQSSSVSVGYVYDSAGRLDRATYSGDAQATFEYVHGARQAAACGSAYAGAGLDGQRTGGSRDGVSYVSCYDARGRQVSTTDPTIAGADGVAELTYDGLGRVTGISGPRALAAQWSAGTQVARLDEIAADGSGLVSTRWDVFGGQVVDKTLVTDEGSSTIRYAGPFLVDVRDGDVVGTSAVSYSLPGGASVTTAPGAAAVLTIPGVDGAALIRVDVPALESGPAAAPGAQPGPVAAYGPYGEPLITPSIADPSPVPTLGWQANAGRETLPGAASIVMMGDRPYHPGLGAFLAADPVIDSGDNLYSYTSGDPINAQDSSGREENWPLIGTAIAAGAALLGSFGAGYLVGKFAIQGRQFAGKVAKGFAYAGIAVSAAAAGGATYLAVQGQSADIGIAIAAAIGAAGVATVGTGLFAKWGASRTARLQFERVKARGMQAVTKAVEKGHIHPEVAPIAYGLVAGLPRMSRGDAVGEINKILGAARGESTKLAGAMKAAAKKKDRIVQTAYNLERVGLDAIEEVSEVASQL